jgi:hypothetical protein
MVKAYTIGRTSSYDKDLKKGGTSKLGRHEDYPGGWVWRTGEEAEEFIQQQLRVVFPDCDPKNFSVYVLRLPNSWEADVSESPARDGVHNLLHDAVIVGKA